ncbi:MAG: diguanylate cyclase [Nitrospirae bacterium]|nr:diguanylate cyclase [Nitrospirota bacterium]
MVKYKSSKNILDKKNSRDRIRRLEIEAAKEIVDEMFSILDGIDGIVYISDIENYNILRVNKYIKDHYGNDIIGKKCFEVFQDGQNKPCEFCTNNRILINGKPAPPVTWCFQNKKTGRWYHCIDKAILWPDKRYVRMEIAIDITELKNSELALRESEIFHKMIFESINDPFNIIDNNYRIVKANESYARLRGKSIEQLIGNLCYKVLYQRNTICDNCAVKETFDTGKPQTKEKKINFPPEMNIWLEIYTYPIIKGGKISHVIEYTRDVTNRKMIEAERDFMLDKLQHLSRTDDLTGLLNRRALIEKLEEEINRAKRYGSKLSLIIIDVDYFKGINDTYGHDVGDRILREVSLLMRESLRNIDVIGRYGGDEFFIILPETSMEAAMEIAERIRLMVKNYPFKINIKREVRVTLSLGIAEYNPESEDIESFIKRSDNALYVAKGEGRDRVYVIEDYRSNSMP